MARPEWAAATGLVLVWILFAVAAGAPFRGLDGTAAYLNAAAPLGILSVGVALLMIGGEFDLSVGPIVGAAGMSIMLLTTHFGWSVWPAIVATLVLCLLIGFLNGYAVVRTGLPSFIVTLATLFIVRGLTIASARGFTRRTQLGGLDDVPGYRSARVLFGSDPVAGFRVSIVWWIAAAALATWVLLRSPYGNWIFGAGGKAEAARNVGVPVARVKIGLFMTTALCAGLVAILQAVRFTGADALRGQLQEFYAIIAVVIGGTLLTGGYGSVIGAAFGALIFGMVRQGIVMAGVDADWFQVVLGGMLLVAVFVNTYTLPAGAPDGMSDGAVGEGRSGMEASAGEGGSGSDDPILEVRGIAMRFGRVVALEEATFAARAGQVTCLLGDNGAGKSTVIKVLAGVHAPTTGEYRVDGEPVRFSSPREAMAAGIATVYQDLAVIPLMSVWRNFYLGSEPVLGRGPLRRIDVRTCRTQALNELEAMGIELSDADQPVGSLSGGERQAVAIARALHFGARVLLLDEPTAALGVRQSNLVLDKIRRAAERGVAVILVTHNPHHAHPIGDRFVVLRQGSVIAKGTRDDLTVDSLARLMSGEAT